MDNISLLQLNLWYFGCGLFNPHLHIIVTDGCFYGDGKFRVCQPPDHQIVEETVPP